MVSRGMLNVRGLDLDDDEGGFGGTELRSSEFKKRKKEKKGCC